MKNIDANTVGLIIRHARKQAAMTQFELAENAEIDSKQLGKIERGIHYPSVPTFLKLIQILKIDVSIFYKDKQPQITLEEQDCIQLIKSLTEKELGLAVKIIEAIKIYSAQKSNFCTTKSDT